MGPPGEGPSLKNAPPAFPQGYGRWRSLPAVSHYTRPSRIMDFLPRRVIAATSIILACRRRRGEIDKS